MYQSVVFTMIAKIAKVKHALFVVTCFPCLILAKYLCTLFADAFLLSAGVINC